jgi:hypothetical protein
LAESPSPSTRPGQLQPPLAAAQWDRYVALGSERLARNLLTGVCSIKGDVQNQTSEPLYVRIWWRGYDDADVFVGTAFAEVYLPAGDHEAFKFESGPFYLGRATRCRHIVRFERYEVKVYDAQ